MKQSFSYLIVAIFISTVTSAQQVLHFSHEPVEDRYSVLELNTEADYFSDQIQNSLVSKLLFGGTIDRESLMDMSSEMDGDNVFGTWIQSGVRYRSLSDSLFLKRPLSLMLEFGVAGYGYSTFPKDLFHLTFLGNADRLGETMSLSNAKAEAMLYQYAGLGVMNESTGSYFSFNLINVQNYFSSEINTLELYTSPDASEIELVYDGEVVVNDSLRGDFLSNSGTGVTLNSRYNFKVGEADNLISMEFRNLGFVSLNDRTQIFEADSSFYFNGVDVDELFSSDNPLSTLTIEDSVALNEFQETRLILMPLDIQGAYYHRLNKADHLSISLRKRFFTEHRGELGINYFHDETESIGYNVGVSYGGYGGLRVNAGAYVKASNWKFYLTTKNLLGAFIESAKGRSVSFGISRTFRTAE